MAEKGHQLHNDIADESITRGKTSKSGIVLRPQPSNDPNDPLVRSFVFVLRQDETKKSR
jgi:hypothetical protein